MFRLYSVYVTLDLTELHKKVYNEGRKIIKDAQGIVQAGQMSYPYVLTTTAEVMITFHTHAKNSDEAEDLGKLIFGAHNVRRVVAALA